jgi:tetratricopeptide (TPR) repeat protein
MGVVFSAHDPELDRRVAVKLLAPAAGRLGARQERLAREARALAKISHPNVVPVFDVGTAGDRLFVAMELVDGTTLRGHVDNRLAIRERMQLLAQAAAGLAAAHAAGVVHRDFKPDNVLVGRDGRVRVSDFGLALASEELDEPGGDVAASPPMTRTGALIGTPAYMAPEQLRGERADATSDEFAFCVTAWEVLFGQRPFVADDTAGLLAAIEQGPREGTTRIDRDLLAALRRGLAFDPARRHGDLARLRELLGEPRRSRRWRVAAVLGGVALLASAGVLASQVAKDDPCARAERGLDTVWNDPAQISFAVALGRTGKPLATEHASAAIRAVVAWSASWRELSAATCRAHRDGTRSAVLFDRQQACLAARRDELAAFIALFAHSDIDPALAPQLAAGLGDVDACTVTSFADAPPVTAEQRRALDDARRALAAAAALRKAGRYREAVRELEQLRTTVDKLADRALAGDVLWHLAMAEIGVGKLDAARDHLSAAAARGEEARDDALKAKAWIELLVLVGDEVVELAEAARLEPLARAAVDRAGGGTELRASLAAATGRVELRRGNFKAAITAFEEATRHHRKRTPAAHYEISNVLNTLAGAHGALGDHARMLQLLDEAKELATAAVGKDHPDVAAIWSNRVEPLHFLGRGEEALTSATTAVTIFERALGGRGLRLAKSIENLAILHAMNERFADAATLFERSRAMTEAELGPSHADVAQAWLNVASAHKDAGALADAAAGYRKAIEIWERALGPTHVDLARPLLGLAKVLLEQKAAAEALPLVQRALAIREAQPGNPAHLAHTLFVHGQVVLAATGDKRRACERISKAFATYMTAAYALGAKFDDDVAEIHAWLAEQKLTCSVDRHRAR